MKAVNRSGILHSSIEQDEQHKSWTNVSLRKLIATDFGFDTVVLEHKLEKTNKTVVHSVQQERDKDSARK